MQTPFYRTDRPFLFSSTPAHHLYNNSTTCLPAIKHTIKAPAHQYVKLPLSISAHPSAHHWKLSTPMFKSSSISFSPAHQHTIEASAHQCLNHPLYFFFPPTSTPSRLQHTNVTIFLYICFAHPPAHHSGITTPMFESSSLSFVPTHQHTIKSSAHQS